MKLAKNLPSATPPATDFGRDQQARTMTCAEAEHRMPSKLATCFFRQKGRGWTNKNSQWHENCSDCNPREDDENVRI
jgi:hypothetical protein